MTKSFAQKVVAVATALTLSGMLSVPAYGQTVAELQTQIQELLALVSQLQSQLTTLQGGSPAGFVSCVFTRPLFPGVTGTDVQCLQRYLNAAGHQVAASGPGSSGNETQTYGPLTQAAVKTWQDANGITYGAFGGYFGPVSQVKYGALKAAASAEEEEEEETPPPAEEEEEETPAEITTPGVEAIVSVEYAPSPANNAVVKEGEVDKPLLGVRVKVKQGDGVVERVKLDLGTSTRFYSRQFTHLSLWDGETELMRVALSSSTVVKDGSRYVVTLDGFKKLIKAGEQADLTIKGTAYAQIDSTYMTAANDPSVYVPSNGVRVIDGAGINQYSPTSNLSARSVDLQQSEAEQAEMTLSKDVSSPKANRVVSDTQGEADNVDMVVLGLRARRGKVKVTDMVASITESSAGSSSASSAYLYRKVGTTWTLLASASLASGGFTWSDLSDVWVNDGETALFKIAVKFTGASTDESTWSMVVQTGDLTLQNSLGDSVTSGGSNVTSENVLVASRGVTLTLVSKSISYTPSSQSASGVLNGTFVVRIKAKGANLYIADTTSTSSFQIRLIDDDNASQDSEETGNIAVSYNQPSGTTTGTGTYLISQDTEVEVTVKVAAQSGAIDALTGFNLGEFYKWRIIGVRWDTDDDATPDQNDTYMDATEWETERALVN